MDRRAFVAGTAGAAGGILLRVPAAAEGARGGALRVRRIRSSFVGGEPLELRGVPARPRVVAPGLPSETVDPNGDFQVGQMYVHSVELERPRRAAPVALLHGGGFTGACFEARLDGSVGWQTALLQAGFDTLVADWVGAGRSPWSRYPEVFRAEPLFRTAQTVWELFRLGPVGSYSSDPAKRFTFGGSRFPARHFDALLRQVVPRFTTEEPRIAAAYDALIAERDVPIALLSHSASGPLALAAGARNPGKVAAQVLVEPSGAPDPATIDLRSLRHIPHLFIWGDNIEQDPSGGWQQLKRSSHEYAMALRSAGGNVTWIDLPREGIEGNSHMLMFDDNGPEIARLITSWLD